MILLANYPENENERESNILSKRRGIILVTYVVHCLGLAKTNLLGYKLRNLAQAFVFVKLNTPI